MPNPSQLLINDLPGTKTGQPGQSPSITGDFLGPGYCSFLYSDMAAMRPGMPRSPSFHSVRNSDTYPSFRVRLSAEPRRPLHPQGQMAGVRLILAARNLPSTITLAIAINYVH